MIKINALSCSYSDKSILKDISLKIENHLTILGANGSGKSTLAKALASLIEYSGEIYIDTTNLQNLSLNERAKLISYIPAKLDIYDPYIKVFEFVLLGRFPYKKSFFDYDASDRAITKSTLSFLKLAHLSQHSIASLSSGESQLILIAQALVQQSKTIIFDEPTANLDPKNSKTVALQIKSLKEYHNIILITHDLTLASFVDSPIAFIKDKKVDYFEDDFFKTSTLHTLYEVEFDALVVKYD